MTPAVPDPAVEALSPLRRYFESHALTAKALGHDDRGWLDALILLEEAAAVLAPVVAAEVERAVEAAAVRIEAVAYHDASANCKSCPTLRVAARIVREGGRP